VYGRSTPAGANVEKFKGGIELKVIVPYRPGMLFRRTYEAARDWEGGCRFVEIRNADEGQRDDRPTYPELLASIWEAAEPVVMLEHDVVPYENAIEEIAGCTHPWCGYRYPAGGGFDATHANLGCTKLSSELIAGTPEFGRMVKKVRDWDKLDSRLSLWAQYKGYEPHRHFPNVEHRGTRHAEDGDRSERAVRRAEQRLGSEFVDIDEHGEIRGEPQYKRKYKPLPRALEPTSSYSDPETGFFCGPGLAMRQMGAVARWGQMPQPIDHVPESFRGLVDCGIISPELVPGPLRSILGV
jgi:hypothetical protein